MQPLKSFGIPDCYSIICETAHPKTGEPGTLLRARNTGLYWFYVLRDGDPGVYRTAPYKWAQDVAASVGKPSDSIQDACIKQMQSMGLKAIDVAHMLPELSQGRICDFLSRRGSLSTHKLQHLLPVLGLAITEVTG